MRKWIGIIIIVVSQILAPFHAMPWQVAPWRDQSKILLLTGSAGGGKSRLAAEKMHALMLRYPHAMGLIVRKTRQSMGNSTVLFLRSTVIGNDRSIKHIKSEHRFEYANGSILAYGGMANEEQREQIRSIGSAGGVDFAWIEEATRLTESDYNELLGRLRGNSAGWRQVILSTNPDAPQHWIYRRLIQGHEASVYYSSAIDNPYNPPDYADTLNKISGILGKRLREGQWVQAEGVVYDQFNQSVHMINPFPIPDDWVRIRSIDFGYTNPFTCQWWALDPDGRMYLYRELYGTGRLVKAWAHEINRLSEGESFAFTVADHDAEDRATLAADNITTIAAIKDVATGIQAVSDRMRTAGDGKPRLFLMRDALVYQDDALAVRYLPTCLEDELPLYVWQTSTHGIMTKEVPVKSNDHGCDAMRYAVMAAPYLGGTGGVWL